MKKKELKIPDDIKSGYLVELQDGSQYLCLRHDQGRFSKILVNVITGKGIALCQYHYDIYRDREHKERDIVKVYGLPYCSDAYDDVVSLYDSKYRPLLWERKLVEMTKEQIERELGYKIKIVVE